MNKNISVPIYFYKYIMTINEASAYFNIGTSKMRNIIMQNKDADFVLRNGNKYLIKRKLFERFIDNTNNI